MAVYVLPGVNMKLFVLVLFSVAEHELRLARKALRTHDEVDGRGNCQTGCFVDVQILCCSFFNLISAF